MQLKRLEIAGFKSFAGRVSIDFASGITAIVGPNGSGKSNIADSIRWVLGEQKTSSLRLQKSEDLIFNGTPKRPKASMAEVSLLLDNSAGSIPVDYGEVEITRKLYRSGESMYLLNGRRTKLLDIQELLARSGFGQDSYTVIAQGMVERLLMGNSAERAQLFEQASGVRQYDLRRQAAAKKLESTQQNLARVEDIITELAPNQALLQRQTDQVARKQALEVELRSARTQYIHIQKVQLAKQQASAESKYAALQADLRAETTKLAELHKQLAGAQAATRPAQFDRQAAQLKTLEQNRAKLQADMLQHQAAVALLEQEVAQLQPATQQGSTIAQAIAARERELQRHQATLQKYTLKIAELDKSIATLNDKLTEVSTKLKAVRATLNKSQKKEYLHHALGLVHVISAHLKNPIDPTKLGIAVFKLQRMIRLSLDDNAAELALDVGRLQNDMTKIMAAREEIVDTQTHEVIRVRAIELDIAALEAELKKLHGEQQDSAQQLVESQKKQQQLHAQQQKLTKLQAQLGKIEDTIDAARSELYAFNRQSQQSTDQQQALMVQVEAQAVRKTELEHRLAQAKQVTTELTHSLQAVLDLQKKWFGNGKLPASQPTRTAVGLDDIYKLATELELLQEIDPGVLQEARDSQDRLKFLKTQQHDLAIATMDLGKLITQLETESSQHFNKGFAKISTAFASYFGKFFGGGSASIELVRDEAGNSQIEFVVTPPQKRSHSLAALSGGEKSLASLALLAAIIHTNPSPFVVLDEVDAAFDDANSQVFARALQDLAKRSQIIIITHNHETMQTAGNLLGITTQSSGDSIIMPLSLQATPTTPASLPGRP